MVTDQYNDEVTGDEQARSIAQEIETQFDKKSESQLPRLED